MRKEWLYWVGGGGGGERGRSSGRRGGMSGEMKETATSAGCMCAVFQLFDLHRFQFPLNHYNTSDDFHSNSPFAQEEATSSKGLEAPRNSLESREPAAMDPALASLHRKEEKDLNFQVGIQLRTGHGKVSPPRVSASASRSRMDVFSSESSSNSPGTKTPSVVARLMGLDLLPECSSPVSSSSSRHQMKSHLHQNNQTRYRNLLQSRLDRSSFEDDISIDARSLPETPRISSARRSDCEHHRLSLQVSKENMNEGFAFSDRTVSRRGRRFRLSPQDENRSPGHYAKQIVKQVKERVSRRVGLDITNTSRDGKHTRSDENLILLNPTKKDSKMLSEISPDGKQSITPSCSPRLRFLDTSKNRRRTNSGTKSPRVSTSDNNQPQGTINPLKPKSQVIIPLQEKQQQEDGKKVEITGGYSSSGLNKLIPQASDYSISNKKEEPFVRSKATNKASFVDKKSKKTPLSSDILNTCSPPLFQVKKDPSPPLTKLPHKQSKVSEALSSKRSTLLSCKGSHSYKHLQGHTDKVFNVPENTNGWANAPYGDIEAEYGDYIQRILKLGGVVNNVTAFTSAKWHTPSNPIDPSIFHHLELFHLSAIASGAGCSTVLSHRCNRRLIFQLVDELLADILRPRISSAGSVDDSLPLVDELCKKIDSFPAANCLVLGDIDMLVDKDLRKSQLSGFLEEEGDAIACEVEGEIVEWLVRETAAMLSWPSGDGTDGD